MQSRTSALETINFPAMVHLSPVGRTLKPHAVLPAVIDPAGLPPYPYRLIPGSDPAQIRRQHYGDVGAVRQCQRLKNVAAVFPVVVEDPLQNCRTLQLSVHEHTDSRSRRAIAVHRNG